MNSQSFPTLLIALNFSEERLKILEGMPHFGWRVLTAGHANELPALAFQHQPNLLLFDLEIAQALDATQESIRIPRILALSQPPDRALSLDLHRRYRACAFISLPADLEILAAQADAILFTTDFRGAEASEAQESRFGDAQQPWLLIRTTWLLTTPTGLPVRLTQSESTFLATLAENPGEPVSRRTMIVALGHNVDYYDMRRLDMLVSRLRQKIQREGGCSLPVRSIHSVGYSFAAPVQLQD